ARRQSASIAATIGSIGRFERRAVGPGFENFPFCCGESTPVIIPGFSPGFDLSTAGNAGLAPGFDLSSFAPVGVADLDFAAGLISAVAATANEQAARKPTSTDCRACPNAQCRRRITDLPK